MMNTTYTLGYSSCPNDTFIFKAIARELIDLNGMAFDIRIEDVETLNQRARQEQYHVTKLSVAALGSLTGSYALLRTGAALGKGCGPLVISAPGRGLDDRENPVIAVPGLGTTAYHLFRFYMDDCFPDQKVTVLPMPFEQVMPAVLSRKADFGVIIHEGRFVYQTLDLELKTDLGQWWEDHTGLPIPLGCIAVRRDIGSDAACRIQDLIGHSIEHAFSNPSAAGDYIRQHAQELDEAVIQQHIRLYVNHFSRDLGKEGEAAILAFFDRAQQAGLIKTAPASLFVC